MWQLCLLLVFLTGCMQLQMLPYLDQLIVLQQFGQDKDAQHKYIKEIDARFDKMYAAYNNGELQKYKTQAQILKDYGAPIVTNFEMIDGVNYKKAVYRYAIQNKGPHKIYLYYNEKDQLIKAESPS